MGNAAISGVNLADMGAVSASSQEILMPAATLLQTDVERRWRSKSNSSFVVADLLAIRTLDTVLLRGLTVTPQAVFRVRLSTSDASGAAGDVYDSGEIDSASSAFDAEYGALAVILSSGLAARYVRIDLEDPLATFVEAGRLIICKRTEFEYNFAYGWRVQWIDRSVTQKSRGGQTLVWQDNAYRTLNINLEWVTAAQRYGVVETIDRVNGLHADVLLITDVESENLARDSIFGLVTNLTPVVQPAAVFDAGGPLFSKEYVIEERL